jgi:replicative DNA helicase
MSWAEHTKKMLIEQQEKDFTNEAGGIMTGFEWIDKHTQGMKPGLILIGGRYELGKTTWMTQMALQTIQLNPSVYWLCFTLDDSKALQLARMVANISHMRINDVRMPNGPESTELSREKRKEGYNKLMSISSKFKVYDQSDKIEGLEGSGNRIECVERHLADDFRHAYEESGDKPIMVVTVDSFHNLETPLGTEGWTNANARTEYLGKKFKEILHLTVDGVQVLPILVSSINLRKNEGRRPSMDDIKDSVGTAYDTDLALLMYNELPVRGDKSKIYFLREDPDLPEEVKTRKYPVVECRIAKNKFSDNKGYIWYEFHTYGTYFNEQHDIKKVTSWKGLAV